MALTATATERVCRDPVSYTHLQTKRFPGYATDVVTDKSIQWLENRDKDKRCV